MTAGLHKRVAQGIVDRALWGPGTTVAVAVSGGRDSVALSDSLVAGAGIHGGELSVATFDHGTRPGSADDAAFVVAWAAELGLPCRQGRATLGPDAAEAACRSARYAFLDALPVERVALAHHRDDQAETVLLALLRGGGTRGRAAMGWRRGRYARPVLDVPREDLAAWASHRGLPWREDPTNATSGPLRNRLRHDVLPRLEAARPGASRALARAAVHAAEDEAHLAAAAAAADPFDGAGWPRDWIASGSPALVRRALIARLEEALWATAGEAGAGAVRSAHLDATRAAARRGRGTVVVSTSVRIVVERDRVHISQGST